MTGWKEGGKESKKGGREGEIINTGRVMEW